MTDLPLRAACIHERYEAHPTDTIAICNGGREVTMTEVTVVFDGPPGPEPGRFIEVENPETGESINLGKWYEVDGLWYLAFDAALGVTDERDSIMWRWSRRWNMTSFIHVGRMALVVGRSDG